MDANIVVSILPGLAALAAETFDVDSYEARCRELGWEISRESWWPDTCFQVWLTEANLRFMAIFEEDETSAGLSICAVGDPCEQPDFYVTEKRELSAAFSDVLQIASSTLGQPAEAAMYVRNHALNPCEFAYWVYSQSFLLLIVHYQQEYSNDPSRKLRLIPRLELRLIPRLGKDSLDVPLGIHLLLPLVVHKKR